MPLAHTPVQFQSLTSAQPHSTVECTLAPKVKLREVESFFTSMAIRLQQLWLIPALDGGLNTNQEEPISNPPATPCKPASGAAPAPQVIPANDGAQYVPAWSSVDYSIMGSAAEQRPKIIRSKVYGSENCSAIGDAVETEMTELCREYPEIAEKNSIMRCSPGKYLINGREVTIQIITIEAGNEPSSSLIVRADLIVTDGPLSQPFLDYMFNTGENEQYQLPPGEAEQLAAPLMQVPTRLEFVHEDGMPYEPFDRIAAMQCARYEAWARDEDARRRLEVASLQEEPSVTFSALEEPPRETQLNAACASAKHSPEKARKHLFSEILPQDATALPAFCPEVPDDPGQP